MELIKKTVRRNLREYDEIYRLMITAFPESERIPLWILRLLELRKMVSFHAFYDENQFCGFLYTAEDRKYIFVLYLAVNDKIRSKGYGSRIIEYLKVHCDKIIVLNVEAINVSKDNYLQRKKRVEFYRKNGIIDTGYFFYDGGERYSVLSSDVERFVPEEYEKLLSNFSFGIWNSTIR